MSMTQVVFYFLILQLAVNEAFSSRVSRVEKGRHANPAPRQRHLGGPDVPSPKDSISTPPRPICLDLFVVVDASSYHYHGDDTEHYVMEMMNVAASLWRSTSLNVDVTLRVVKILILKENQENLEIANHANLSLRRFCQWQQSYYVTDGVDRFHFDAAILITRLNIEIGGNYDATGIAYNRGVCDPQYQCALCEDSSPMVLSHTIAHEIGHLLGVRHDGDRNACPDLVNIMSGYDANGRSTFIWSQCSRQALLEFLSSTRASCLVYRNINTGTQGIALDTTAMPGRLYDADYQCQMLYGPMAKACSGWDGSGLCVVLKCRVDVGRYDCVSDGRPALQGTSCGLLRWCFKGTCINRSKPKSTHPAVPLGETLAFTNRHKDKLTGELHCSECNTFPYMDTPVPTIKPETSQRKTQRS